MKKKIIGSIQAQKASKAFILKVKNGFYKMKTPPDTSDFSAESKVYESCISLAESDLLKEAVKKL